MAENKDYNILFGSGELFIVPDGVDLEKDTEEEIESKLVLVGESSGEAGLIIENEFHDVRGGRNHGVLASFVTSEEIKFNAGLCTLDLKTMSQFLASNYSETVTERVLKLGGNYTIPINRLRFVHYKRLDGKRLILDMHKAMNKAGLELNFNAEEHSVFNLEFTLMKAKGKDNIVTITEEIGEATEPPTEPEE